MKNEVVASFKAMLNDKVHIIEEQIEQARYAILSETKSSAGDKYETGRAMAQNEMFRLSQQLSELHNSRNSFFEIDFDSQSETIRKGSLIETDFGWFLLSEGIGSVSAKSQKVTALSAQSPLGIQLLNKKIKDQFEIRNKTYQVLQVL